ncbi:hypothetical protein [Cupriavidus basilensis]|uniref:hypothetical protein n=1 Tax=Cupriavidus basilensis TaxID=68895 RepID=UPI0020A67729|nr:hypothetical protein [Cupriavidus basilensis]MCP3023255.1 hypothetical protein [Cupriavidus basilensis]
MKRTAAVIARPIARSVVRYTDRYDAEDLAKGTFSLNFAGVPPDPTLRFNFVIEDYRAWVDDLSWPYGVIGIFKVKA